MSLVLNGQSFNVVTVVDDSGQLQKFSTKELFKINKDHLTTELMKFAEDFGWWSRLAAELAHQKRTLKTVLEQTEAKVSLSIRRGGGGEGGVKFTEKAIEAMIIADPLVMKVTEDFNEICRLHDLITSVTETLRMKQEMIKLTLTSKEFER